LYELFHDLPVFAELKNTKKFGSNQKERFGRLFRIPRRLLHDRAGEKVFNFMIKTDGVGASVLVARWKPKDHEICAAGTPRERAKIFERRKQEVRRRELERLRDLVARPDAEWMGCDPGRKEDDDLSRTRSLGHGFFQPALLHGIRFQRKIEQNAVVHSPIWIGKVAFDNPVFEIRCHRNDGCVSGAHPLPRVRGDVESGDEQKIQEIEMEMLHTQSTNRPRILPGNADGLRSE
jgi:hypothetical protein